MKQETLYKGEKPLDKMSDKELTDYWTKRVQKFLLGQKIVKVEYFFLSIFYLLLFLL